MQRPLFHVFYVTVTELKLVERVRRKLHTRVTHNNGNDNLGFKQQSVSTFGRPQKPFVRNTNFFENVTCTQVWAYNSFSASKVATIPSGYKVLVGM